jgi:hypothetical protein
MASIFEKNDQENIENIYDKINNKNEFEIMFFNFKNEKMSYENYLKILKYINYKNKSDPDKLKLEHEVTLDISYSQDKNNKYRITISSLPKINKYMEMLHQRKNHVIFSVLAGLYGEDKDIKLIKKIKNEKNIFDINDYDLRVRLSDELDVEKNILTKLKSLDETNINSINFRYKQRLSLIIINNNDTILRVDLTDVKMSNNINKLEKIVPHYELEIDISSKKTKLDKKYLTNIYTEINILLKIIQQSNFIISKRESDAVIKKYTDLLKLADNETNLDIRNAHSLEVQHMIETLQNKYAVTDKTDGERYFLAIFSKTVYIISGNLSVKAIRCEVPEKYNNSILDGEYYFIASKNRYLFLCFDCLFNKGEDVRDKPLLFDRLANADEIIDKCFIFKNQKGYKFDAYKEEFNIDKITKFHEKNIMGYINAINHDIQYESKFPLIRRKYFMNVFGGQDNEVFKNAFMLWNKYITDKDVKLPYILDGLIFTPLDQKYTASVKEAKYAEYKWKPNEKNSIDFYIKFEKNKDNNILTLYDNSRETQTDEEIEEVKNKPYKIVNLHVGKSVKGEEHPILFEPEKTSIRHLAYLYLENGEVRDIYGNIIQDDTVVEFYYEDDVNILDRHRWVPIRTRYDKTESVKKFGKKYGNYYDVAYKIWRSIKNPILMSDFGILSNDKTYKKHIDVLRGKIDHSIILSDRKENIYYQISTNLAKPMRNFHNWIKSILMYTIFNGKYFHADKLTALDIGFGRGGDIMKYYYVKIGLCVGIDVDNNGLISPVDGALSRYNQMRKNKPNFPQMFFIHADARTILHYNEQNKILGGMSNQNKELIEKYLNKKFKYDFINCQFAFHYFLQNETSWENILENINLYLKEGGYLLITTLDGDMVANLLSKNDQHTLYYTNNMGEKKILFDIVKKYDNSEIKNGIKLGIAVDFHNATFQQEGKYVTEYLVQKDFMKNEFLKKCNMTLEDTDTFENLYNINKRFFEEACHKEQNEKTRQFLLDAKKFYDLNDEVNRVSYEYSKLNRYYVFRKN